MTEAIKAILELACEQALVVCFGYEKPDGDESERTVSPSAVFETVEGHWLLFGYDHDRAAPRQFRLDRIAGLPGFDSELTWEPVE